MWKTLHDISRWMVLRLLWLLKFCPIWCFPRVSKIYYNVHGTLWGMLLEDSTPKVSGILFWGAGFWGARCGTKAQTASRLPSWLWAWFHRTWSWHIQAHKPSREGLDPWLHPRQQWFFLPALLFPAWLAEVEVPEEAAELKQLALIGTLALQVAH